MINAPQLLADLTRLLKRLEEDLRQRIAEVPELKTGLQAEWQTARDADRTAETFESWGDQIIAQAGVHWLLSCVFLRFIEDNELVERPWLGGTPQSGRLALARDRHEAYFREKPLESDRDYLLACFREAGALPGLATFFDQAHNPVFRLGISGDAAMALRQFWQQVDPNTGTLVHDFTDPDGRTRFLGDLYQDLSEATRKRYALLQTPEFVEEFILDRTLTPAIREFGFREVRMIDPTCGSGHFLLGGFHRLVDEWMRHEPARNPRDIAQRALDAVAGVDLNPFAVAISRFRLLVAALKVSDVRRLSEAPNFKLSVAIGDSLLHGKRFGMTATESMFEGAEHYQGTGLAHVYSSEDLAEVRRILGRQYHAVVGNPPYIVVQDATLNRVYRERYASCGGQYSLGAPFTERFFEFALTGRDDISAGFIGLITTNSFMRRRFGVRLIQEVLPRVDLTHVIDTSGAHIPGHGTPTVILFGRHRAPLDRSVRTVRRKKGEPAEPANPSRGLVWLDLLEIVDRPGSATEYVSCTDTPREDLRSHPWNLSDAFDVELFGRISSGAAQNLADVADVYGGTGRTSADDAFVAPAAALRRRGGESAVMRVLVEGDQIRDYGLEPGDWITTPYSDGGLVPLQQFPGMARDLWRLRTTLGNRVTFGRSTYFEESRSWWEWHQVNVDRLFHKNVLCFAFVATHNHFCLDTGGKVFKQSAPVVRLHAAGDLELCRGMLGLLNSSSACFWMKQVFHDKGNGGIGGGIASEDWEQFYEFTSTGLTDFPVPAALPTDISARMSEVVTKRSACRPQAALRAWEHGTGGAPTPQLLIERRQAFERLTCKAIYLQEEIDWKCYGLYSLLPVEVEIGQITYPGSIEVALGERAFEIALARRMAQGRETTTWFERHGSTPITDIPSHWPEDYRHVVQRRIDLIERDRNIALIERPEFKRRWNTPLWEDMERSALRDWLLDRLESSHLWPANADHPPQLTTANRLADKVRGDADFLQIAELYAGHSGFDLAQIVAELVADESVPFLPVLRYTDSGLRKRAQWEDTWALQRREDAGEKVGKIPVPPKYQSKDFRKADVWRLRGGLDVLKERWVSYPGCERGADPSLVLAWAGWNHLQQATALAAFYLEMKENEGWESARLQPLLAGLLELVPWLEQWHNEIDPAYGERMSAYYRGFINDEARALGFTVNDLRAWKPVAAATKRSRKKAAQPS